LGHYAIILHCQEESSAGYLDEDEPEGDTVELFQLEDSGDCPVVRGDAAELRVLPALRKAVEMDGEK